MGENNGFSMHLVACTGVILSEVESGMSQNSVALTYAMAIKSEAAKADNPDWHRINRVIVGRWNAKALARIKRRAWGIVEGRIEP